MRHPSRTPATRILPTAKAKVKGRRVRTGLNSKPLTSTSSSLSWLGATYRDTKFWTERDIVYVLQRHLADVFRRKDTGWRVFNGHRVNRAI